MDGFEQRLRKACALRRDVVREPSDAAYAKMSAFAALLEKWNGTHNLTSVQGLDQWVDALFFDSWLVQALMPEQGSWIDVGSGGGFPALVLLAEAPDRQALLFEKVAKKRSFLQVAAGALGYKALQVAPGAFPGALPAGPRVFTSRATFAPADWLAMAREHAAPGDTVIVQCSQDALPDGALRSIETTLPLTGAKRRLGAYGK